ncbi:MAG: DHH family phosphoesterase [Clostridia bacterium]|nr:DHH family phosphoesterase [Clostridia bacterium]
MSSNRNIDISSFDLTLMSAGTGLVLLIVALATAAFTEISLGIIALVFVIVLAIFEAAICYFAYLVHKRHMTDETSKSLEHLISEVVRQVDFPSVITTADGKILWANRKMLTLCGAANQMALSGKNLSVYTGIPMNEIIGMTGKKVVTVAETNFYAYSYLMEAPDRDYWMTTLEDRTEIDELEAQINSESPVVAYVSVDNLDELAQYVQGSYREAAAKVNEIITDWAHSIGALIREYDREKYLLVFPKDRLDECIESKFDILDRIREVRFGDENMSVTVSMGVSGVGKDITERSRNAESAHETALQRGGDQVALRTPTGIDFFGGKTKINQKRTKVRSRVISDKLISHITEAGNVLIMGHKNPDFDSIGSCIGLARLALAYNPNVKIVIDSDNSNFRCSTERLIEAMPEYEEIFISGARGLDMVRTDTLLIMSDVNNLKIVESSDIAANVYNTIIIDHHRKIAEFDREPLIAYIEPSASSASELVSELIEITSMGTHASDKAKLSRHEANVMLAGIMLDTKNFTRTTSERTFSAALYLRGAGADPEYARTFFFADLSSFVTEAKLGSEVRLYRERIAITVCEGNGTPDDRIAASKAADTLLTVQNIDAAFVLIRTDEAIAISARSNGKINVQLILEKIGGGGHFDAAGAQVKNTVSKEVLEQLKGAIDEYLDGDIRL